MVCGGSDGALNGVESIFLCAYVIEWACIADALSTRLL